MPQWVLTQKKTFTNWCNQYLKADQQLQDLSKDFGDGVRLIVLLENLTENSIGKYNQKPRMRVHMVENASKALRFVLAQNIKLVGIGAEDIVDGDVKLILGLVWMLIQHRYTLMNRKQGVDVNLKNDLLKWIRRKVQPYPVPQPSNFKQSFQDGRVLYALVDSLKNLSQKDKDFDFANLSGKPIDDVKLAISWAEKNLEVPGILDPSDMVDFPDELSNITYLAGFLKYATAEPDPTDATKSTVEDWKRYPVNVPGQFKIISRKETGEQQPQGGDLFDITLVSSGLNYTPEVVDNQNGTYDVKFLPTKLGKLLGNVALAETHVALSGTPLYSYVIPEGTPKFEAYGSGLNHGHADRPLKFNVKITDQKEQPLDVPVDCIEIAMIRDGDAVNAAVKGDNGSYEVNYQIHNAGDYKVVCKLFGEEVASYDLTIHEAINYSLISTSLTGEGIDGGELPDKPVSFVAELSSGNKPLPVNIDDVSFFIKGPYSHPLPLVKLESLGKFVVEYLPKEMGDYNVSLAVHGGKLAESNPSFTIGGLKCILSGPGVKGGSIKRPLKFKVGFYDSNGKVAASAFKALDTDNSGKIEKNEVKAFISKVSAIPKVKEMFLKLLGDFSGSQEEIVDKLTDVVFEKFDEDKSGDITLTEFKSWGSSVPFVETLFAVSEGQLEVKITGPDDSLNPTVEPSQEEPGSFNVSYQPKKPGQYAIQILVNKRSVIGEPVIAHCYDTDFHPEVTGNGFTKPAYTQRLLSNTLRILSDSGEPLPIPTNLLDVSITGPTSFQPALNQHEKQPEYNFSYSTQQHGEYLLQVGAFGEPLGAPLKLAINDRQASSTETSFVETQVYYVNKPGQFKIIAVTGDGKKQDVGGDKFTVKLVGNKNTEFLANVVDNDDGSYTVSFTPTEYGKLLIDVKLDGASLKDHPIKVFVLPDVPFEINLISKGSPNAYRNFPQRFIAEILDSKQQPIPVPEDCFSVSVKSPVPEEAIAPQIVASPNDFDVTWTPTNVGDHQVEVAFFGNSKTSLTVPVTEKPATDASKSSILDLDCYVVGVPGEFTVSAVTSEGVQQTVGGDKFTVKLVGNDGNDIPTSIQDNLNGTYHVQFTPTQIGKLEVDVKLNEQSLKDLPTSTWVTPGWDSSSLSIEGPEAGNSFRPVKFKVNLEATPTPSLPLPPSVFTLKVSTSSNPTPSVHPLDIEALSPTSYSLSATFDKPDKYELNFSVFKDLIPGCPRHLAVTDLHPAFLCSVLITQGIENAVVRVPTEFKVMATDVYDKPLAGAKFEVQIRGPTCSVPATVKEESDGKYAVQYKPKEAGKLKISVLMDGQNIVGSPFTVYAVPNDCMITLMKGKGCYRGAVFEKLSFEVVAYLQSNEYKKPVPLSAIGVEITGPEEVKPTITASTSNKGTYIVAYSVKSPGVYTIKTRVFGREIGQAQPEIVPKDKYKQT
uniref:Uncharacterized protein n=1 Tax=Arcella intermedia TaxID=1963864 RepID=A0A6B2KWL7_9EUKA